MTKMQWALVALLGLLATAETKAEPTCKLPSKLPNAKPDLPSADQPVKNIPIGGFTLSASWSPQFCRSINPVQRADASSFQCDSTNHFGFILHGLWPTGTGAEWPQYCRRASLLTEQMIRANLCMSPSVQLLQHEWSKHGTCMTSRPGRYFATQSRLYKRLRFPDMGRLAAQQGLTVGDVVSGVTRLNQGWRSTMVGVVVDREGWLSEIWFCLDRRYRPRPCSASLVGVAPPSTKVKIWIDSR